MVRRKPPAAHELPVPRIVQPDDTTCGPTCLAQVSAYFRRPTPVSEILTDLGRLEHGGTLAVFLAIRALELGFHAVLYPMGVRVFDPTWWSSSPDRLLEKLQARHDVCDSSVEREVHRAWMDFLRRGGQVRFEELTPHLLRSSIDRGHPLTCGLNVTWLYQESREQADGRSDDIGGDQVGHFVTIAGYAEDGMTFDVRDPHWEAPFGVDGHYRVAVHRLIHAILIGDRTRDAVLLEIWPRGLE